MRGSLRSWSPSDQSIVFLPLGWILFHRAKTDKPSSTPKDGLSWIAMARSENPFFAIPLFHSSPLVPSGGGLGLWLTW